MTSVACGAMIRAQQCHLLLLLLLQESGGNLPQVVFGTAPHDHTKCDGKVYNQSGPACLPAEQGESRPGAVGQRLAAAWIRKQMCDGCLSLLLHGMQESIISAPCTAENRFMTALFSQVV